MIFPRQGLYALTETRQKTTDQIVNEVEAALRGGAVAIQMRDKRGQDNVSLAQRLLAVCHRRHAPLIINDDIGLAEQIEADGVHLGRNDASVTEARRRLGKTAIIGASCYDDVQHALHMQQQGVDYVAFGRFFPSSSKPHASQAAIETLRLARQSITIPIIAIGGITPANGRILLDAGADLLAAIGGVFNRNPEQSARGYMVLFDQDHRLCTTDRSRTQNT